jgi:hypothetical protein
MVSDDFTNFFVAIASPNQSWRVKLTFCQKLPGICDTFIKLLNKGQLGTPQVEKNLQQFDKIFLKVVQELSGETVYFNMKNPTSGVMEKQLFKIEDEVRVAAVHCLVELMGKFDKHLFKKYLKYLCQAPNKSVQAGAINKSNDYHLGVHDF